MVVAAQRVQLLSLYNPKQWTNSVNYLIVEKPK